MTLESVSKTWMDMGVATLVWAYIGDHTGWIVDEGPTQMKWSAMGILGSALVGFVVDGFLSARARRR